MIVDQSDKDFIEAHRHHYNTLIQAQFLGNLDGSVLNRILEIIKKYFAPTYLANLWCQPCVADMVKYLYTQYDAIPKEAQVKEVEPPKQAEPTIKHETFPKHDEPVKVVDTPVGKKKPGRKPKGK